MRLRIVGSSGDGLVGVGRSVAVEQLLLKQDYELLVARFEAECYRTRHRDATFSAAVEQAEPEISERSEERVRKKMAKLMLPGKDDGPRT